MFFGLAYPAQPAQSLHLQTKTWDTSSEMRLLVTHPGGETTRRPEMEVACMIQCLPPSSLVGILLAESASDA